MNHTIGISTMLRSMRKSESAGMNEGQAAHLSWLRPAVKFCFAERKFVS
jgi:hypothetical protein